jgi:hypothetical protein
VSAAQHFLAVANSEPDRISRLPAYAKLSADSLLMAVPQWLASELPVDVYGYC